MDIQKYMGESEKRTDLIGFYFIDTTNEYANDVHLMFSAYPDMHISKLHSLCRRFALALGYTEKTVDDYFGEEYDE